MNLKEISDKGKELYNNCKFKEALDLYNEALLVYQEDPELLNSAGAVYSAMGQFDMAAVYYKKALEKDPSCVYAINNLGNSLRKQDKTEEAIICYKKAIELERSSWEYYYNLSCALYEMENSEEALDYLLKAGELSPQERCLYDLTGLIYLKMEKYDEAVKCFEKALSISSDFASYLNLGKVFHKKRDFNTALKHYRKALGISSHEPLIYKYIGDLYNDMTNIKQAVRYYENALELKMGKDKAIGAKILFMMAMNGEKEL